MAIHINPVIKRDAMLGGGLVIAALMVARFVPHGGGVRVPAVPDASGNMVPFGGNVASPPFMPGQSPGFPTTPPDTSLAPSPPANAPTSPTPLPPSRITPPTRGTPPGMTMPAPPPIPPARGVPTLGVPTIPRPRFILPNGVAL